MTKKNRTGCMIIALPARTEINDVFSAEDWATTLVAAGAPRTALGPVHHHKEQRGVRHEQ